MSVYWILDLCIVCLGFFLVRLFNQVSLDLRRLVDSVENLNVKMAVIVEKTDHHERRISRLEEKGEL